MSALSFSADPFGWRHCRRLLAAVTGSQAAISDEIRIGYLDDMSGPIVIWPAPVGQAIRLARTWAVRPRASRWCCSMPTTRTTLPGANTAREWIDRRNVDLIAGLNASPVAIAVTRLVEEKNRFAIVSTAATSALTNEYCTPNHLHYVYDTYSVSNGAARAIVANGGKSWYLLSADYAFGHSMEEQVSRAVAESGGQVVGKARHPLPTSDFSSYVLQAQASSQIIGPASASSIW